MKHPRTTLRITITALAFGLIGAVVSGVFIRPLQQVAPEYPAELQDEGLAGSATITVLIDSQGFPKGCAVYQASRPEFGKAALRAAQQWRFEPTGSEIKVRLPFRFEGSLEARLSAAAEREVFVPIGKRATPIWEGELGMMNQPSLTDETLPEYPPAMLADSRRGKVKVRFLLDRQGFPLNPEVISSNHDAFIEPVLVALVKSRYKMHGAVWSNNDYYIIMEETFRVSPPET